MGLFALLDRRLMRRHMPRPVTFVTAAAMMVAVVVVRILLQALGPVAIQIATRKLARTYRSGALPDVFARATKTLSLLSLTLSCVSIATLSMQKVLTLKSQMVPSSADLHTSRKETPMVRIHVSIMLTFPSLTKLAKSTRMP